MNTQYLQHHLEYKLSALANACVNEGVEDSGLICEILCQECLSDERRLHYISEIDCTLGHDVNQNANSEISYLAFCEQDPLRIQKRQRWDTLHKLALELQEISSSRRQVPLERFLHMVSALNTDNDIHYEF